VAALQGLADSDMIRPRDTPRGDRGA
jgi:hypothetical protein